MSTLHAQSSNKALIYSMIQMKRGDPFFLHRWRLLGALTAIEISLGLGTKTHWTSFRLYQLVDEEPTTVSNLDSLRKLTTIRFIFPVEADRAINNPVSHFGVGGWQPAGDCSSTSPARNTFGSHPISGGRKKPVPSRCKLLITQCGRACHDGGGSIICVQFRIDFALLFISC